jgi:hypothetical protein
MAAYPKVSGRLFAFWDVSHFVVGGYLGCESRCLGCWVLLEWCGAKWKFALKVFMKLQCTVVTFEIQDRKRDEVCPFSNLGPFSVPNH